MGIAIFAIPIRIHRAKTLLIPFLEVFKVFSFAQFGSLKKQALLKKFGSVEKIKQASIKELMEVNGIDKELAIKIKQFK